MIRAAAIPGALGALALCAAPAARAATEPLRCAVGKDADERVRCIAATPETVVTLKVQRGASVVIEVPDGERVVAVPVSDDAIMRGNPRASVRVASSDDEIDLPDQQATTDGNLSVSVRGPTVVVKPHRDLLPQPLFVVTERDGRQTRYRFEIQTVGAADAYYSVRLRNPAAEAAERRARWQEAAARRDQREVRDRLAQANASPCAAQTGVNLAYYGRGDADLAPEQVCDNGRQTFMRWPGSRRLPAVFAVLPDGKEAAVNESPNPDGWVVAQGRARRLVLRDAGRVLCLVNANFGVVGQATGTGTVAADVVREVKEEAR